MKVFLFNREIPSLALWGIAALALAVGQTPAAAAQGANGDAKAEIISAIEARRPTWCPAESTTFYHSLRPDADPKGEGGELGAPEPTVETSDRRFREEEFLLPRRLTEGRSKIRVRVEVMPVGRPILPGGELLEERWSEIGYKAYSIVMPEFELAAR